LERNRRKAKFSNGRTTNIAILAGPTVSAERPGQSATTGDGLYPVVFGECGDGLAADAYAVL
jgi:hypothetical protein